MNLLSAETLFNAVAACGVTSPIRSTQNARTTLLLRCLVVPQRTEPVTNPKVCAKLFVKRLCVHG
jgi:hypothetical protein